MNRRHFLRQSGAALAAGAILGPGASRALAAARAAGVPAELGIQLYTLRDIFPGDVNGVLEMLSRYGYGEVETAGYADRSPAAFRAALDAHGLVSPSAHVGIDLVREDIDGVLEAAQTVGHRYVTIPWLAPDQRPDRDGYLALADEINGFGERAQAAGLKMAYHNHDFEFDTFGTDRPAYFDFVERLDPALVALELDLFWVVVAGYDPVDVFDRYPGRFPMWHVKDGTGTGDDVTQTVVGDGQIDWPRIFAASETSGLEHAFIEADSPPNDESLAFAEASIDYVESLRD
jgi:sugar phosphate isomerase/epimerase